MTSLSSTSVVDPDDLAPELLTQDLGPVRISEIILRTSNFDAMKVWYQRVLGAKPSLELEREHGKEGKVDNFRRLCFLRIYASFPYTEVFGLFELPDVAPSQKSAGLHHSQFRIMTLDGLFARFERLRSVGITPYQTFNHGPSMSFYYEDPDGNLVELNAPNFDTEKEYLDYFKTPAFQKNVAGVEIDADDVIRRYRNGENRADLVRMPE